MMTLFRDSFRQRLALALVFLLLPVSVAVAAAPTAQQSERAPTQTPTSKGNLPSSTKTTPPREPTAEQLAEANRIYRNCTSADGGGTSYYDCSCLSLTFLQLRVKNSELTSVALGEYELTEQARKACVNVPGIAGKTYQECKVWAAPLRRNVEEFCGCYANRYAAAYAANPTSVIKVNDRMVRTAMQACGAASESIERVEREKLMIRMQKEGLYEQLFPSAKGTLPSNAKPQPTGAAKAKTPAQILSDHLNSADTDQ